MFMKTLVLSLVLVFALALPVQARQPEACSGQADFVAQVTELRDMGVTKENLLAAISYDDSAPGRQAKKEFPKIVDQIYAKKNEKKTPEEMAKAYYKQCLTLPNWPANNETRI